MKKSPLDTATIVLTTGLGTGFCPVAPGTVGSLLGPPLVWGVMQLGLPLPATLAIGTVFVLAGIPLCTRAMRVLDSHDPGEIVYDEISAFWIVFLPQIVTNTPIDLYAAIAGFVLFRIFDIWKPWPVRQLEKLPDGAGVLVDDLAAGVYAGAILFFGRIGVENLLGS